MKAWQVSAWGEPESMTLTDVPDSPPAANQVAIRVRAAGLNFFDVLQVQGKYQEKPPFPLTPGAEAAGTVEKVGDEVTEFSPGDAVMAFTWGGGMGERALANANWTFRLPPGMDFVEAAAMPIVY